MQIIHSINEYFVAFLLEVIALYYFGKLGSFFFQNRGSKIFGTVLSLAMIILIWANFFAPNASHRLSMPAIFIGKLLILLLPSYLFFYEKNYNASVIWAVVVCLHLILSSISGGI